MAPSPNEHHHGISGSRRILVALVLTTGFMVVEVVGGLLSGSLALLADAGHMLTDSTALALSWLAFRVSTRPADDKRTFGYHRLQILAAFVNGLSLILIVGWILYEAARRLLEPVAILGVPMIAVAATGLAVNVVAFLVLHGDDRQNLNLRGAALHVLGDLLGSVAAIVAAVVILTTGWYPIDPLLSVLVAALIAHSAWDLVKRSANILLEGAPDWLDVDGMKHQIQEEVAEVDDIYHVHVWTLTAERQLLTMHVSLSERTDQARVLAEVKRILEERYGIDHSTIEVDLDGSPTKGPVAC